MTWEIVLGLITIGSCLVTVCTIAFKLSKVLTSLQDAINGLTEFKKDSKSEHKEMHEKLEDHEERIVKLEVKAEIK